MKELDYVVVCCCVLQWSVIMKELDYVVVCCYSGAS